MLRWLLFGALLGWACARVFLGHPDPERRKRRLWRHEAAFIAAASDALFPRGGAVAPSGCDAGVPDWVDRYVDAVPRQLRVLMRCLFLLIEHATLLFPAPPPRGRRRFSALGLEQRTAVLEGWRSSRLFPRRLVFTSLRALLTMGYFAHPPVQRALDVAPREIETPLCEADFLYPPVGLPRSAARERPPDWSPPPPAPPLTADTPLHADFAEASR